MARLMSAGKTGITFSSSINPLKAIPSENHVAEEGNGFRVSAVDGPIAFVEFRDGKVGRRDAREIAERIARMPAAYMKAIALVGMTGVADLRPMNAA